MTERFGFGRAWQRTASSKVSARAAQARIFLVRNCELPGWPVAYAARFADPNGLLDDAMRQWFEVHLRQSRWPLACPSVLVLECWTAMAEAADYESFCINLFGVPLPVASNDRRLDVTWRAACQAEEIDPARPKFAPVLFLVDQTLQAAGGNVYTTQCGGRVCRVFPPEVCVNHAFTPSPGWAHWRDGIDTHPT